MSGVNTLFNGLMNETWFTDSPPRYLKLSSAGGMALQSSVAERWADITGTSLVQGYGLTETSPVLTFNPFDKPKPGTIGIPVPSTDVVILGSDGKQVASGEPGEIAAKGPQIMKGYWENPAETKNVMSRGYFLTGDIGVMDEDGYITIVDRKKDMVIVSGFNVYPNEVEDAISAHPGIDEVAVIGVHDGDTVEAVKAFVTLHDQGITPDEVRDYAKQHLTNYKVPKHVEIRDELPKSNVGKILRKDLREEEATRVAAE